MACCVAKNAKKTLNDLELIFKKNATKVDQYGDDVTFRAGGAVAENTAKSDGVTFEWIGEASL